MAAAISRCCWAAAPVRISRNYHSLRAIRSGAFTGAGFARPRSFAPVRVCGCPGPCRHVSALLGAASQSSTPVFAVTWRLFHANRPVSKDNSKMPTPEELTKAAREMGKKAAGIAKSFAPSSNFDVGSAMSDHYTACATAVTQGNRQQILHYTNLCLLASLPVALILSPSILNWPVDLALGVLVPVHSHIGLRSVLIDYVPDPYRKQSLLALLVLSVLLGLGFLKLNLFGAGVTESVKALWRTPAPKVLERKGRHD